MKGDFEKQLSTIDLLMQNGSGYLINHSGRIIALLTLLLATVVTFANVSFSAFTGESFTVGLLVMLFSSYVIYFSLQSSGERLGEGSEEYQNAIKKYGEVRKTISADDISDLREFCFEYAKKDAEYRKRALLAESGLTMKEYCDFKAGVSFPRRTRRALKRCDGIKPARLTPPLLLSRDRTAVRCELKGPSSARLISTLLGLLPSTLTTFFTVSIILTAKDELNITSVMEGIVKLSALPLIGFKGYTGGYSYVKNNKSRWIETKAEILEEFLTDRKKMSEKD